MNKEQFLKLTDIEKNKKVINIADLTDKSDRTLLYGYTCERDTWHVYIKNEKIYTVIYKRYEGETPQEVNVFDNMCYVPDKRLYPECCDYEFCKLLKEKGVHLPFTTWQDRTENKKYWAEIL